VSRSLVGNAGRGAIVVIFTTVLGGCALMCAAGVLAQSAFSSGVAAQRLADADIVVTAPQTVHQDADLAVALPERATVPASLVQRLRDLPAVTAAVGDLSFPAAIVGTRVDDVAFAGHGWSSTELLDDAHVIGRRPRGDGQVALEVPLHGTDATRWHPGDTISAVTAGRRTRLTVTAVIRGGCEALRTCGLYLDDHTAARLAGRLDGPKRGTVDLVALRTATDPQRLTAAVQRLVGPHYVVLSGSDVGQAEVIGAHAARGFLLILASSFSGVMLLIVGFAVTGALTVSVAAQRRDLALLRAVGATPRQVRQVIARQAMGGTVAAVIPGAFLGYLLAERFAERLAHLGLLPAQLSLSIGPFSGLAAAGLMAATVRVAAWSASLGPSQLSPLEALNEGEVERSSFSPRRFNAGLLLILASVPIALVPVLSQSQDRAAGAAVAGLVEVIGLALAGPGLLKMMSGHLFARASSRLPVMVWTGLSNIYEHALQSAGAISALAMMVVFVLTSVMSNTTVAAAAEAQVTAGVRADVAYAAPTLGGVPVQLVGHLLAAPGVQAAEPVTTTTVLLPHRVSGNDRVETAAALGIGPNSSTVLDLGIVHGDLGRLTGNTVAVAEGTAQVGDTKQLILGDGARTAATVVATYRHTLGFGPVVLSQTLASGHTSGGLASMVLVALRSGAEPPPAPLGVERANATAFMPSSRTGAQTWVNFAMLAVLLGYVLISVANRLVVTMTRRRTELVQLQLVGATPGQLLRMVRVEAAVLAACATGGGLLLAALPLGLVGLGYLGRPWASGPPWLTPAVSALVFVVSWVAYEWPARRLIAGSLT
jgi:putative ABC transport system permease protein